jgi:hypothetical protein
MKTKYYYILAFVVVIFAGFVIYGYTQRFEQPPVAQDAVITPTDKESCEAHGGKWGMWRNAIDATPECNLPAADAGEKCTDSSQCESYCQVPKDTEIGSKVEGKCYKYKVANCMQEVKNGIANAKWCY